MYSQLIVFSEAIAGRHEEFNDWYTWVHIRDVLRLSRVVYAVQRFKRAATQVEPGGSAKYPQQYLAIYETSDPERMTRDHQPVFTSEMPISSAYSFSNICEAYYDTIALRGRTPAQLPRSDLIIEQIEATDDGAGFLEWYLDMRLPALARLPYVVSAMLGKASRHQMFPGPHPPFSALYRTTNLAASVEAWKELGSKAPLRREGVDFSVICFSPLIERLAAVEVLEADSVSQEIARQKREQLGDRVHRGAPGFKGFE
jgi:hypothetical protein